MTAYTASRGYIFAVYKLVRKSEASAHRVITALTSLSHVSALMFRRMLEQFLSPTFSATHKKKPTKLKMST